MTFSSMRQAVDDTWQFIFPPILNLFLLSITFYFLGGAFVIYSIGDVPIVNFSFLKDEAFQKFIEFYGINKVTPMFFLFAIVLIFYALQKIVTTIGSILPINFVYLPSDVLVYSSGLEPARVASLWNNFPTEENIYNLYSVIQKKLTELESSDKSQAVEGVIFWKKNLSRAQKAFESAKFLAFWSIVISIIVILLGKSIIPTLVRLSGIEFVIFVAGFAIVIRQVFCVEQLVFAELWAIETILSSQSERNEASNFKLQERESQIIQMRQQDHENWWKIRTFNPVFWTWFYKHFLKKQS